MMLEGAHNHHNNYLREMIGMFLQAIRNTHPNHVYKGFDP